MRTDSAAGSMAGASINGSPAGSPAASRARRTRSEVAAAGTCSPFAAEGRSITSSSPVPRSHEVRLLARRRRFAPTRPHDAPPRPFASRLTAALVIAVLLLTSACRRDDAEPRARRDSAAASAAPAYVATSAAKAPIAATRYSAGSLEQSGKVRGSIEIDGEVPGDTIIHPISDQEVCGDSIVSVPLDHDGPRLVGAVVWLANVRGGKPLPLSRRYELSIERCQMTPRTQAVVAGGTINVYNNDRALHRPRFVRQGVRQPVATVSYSDDGQVVPVSAALERPGLVEVGCDVHPWARAYIAVFDQPYFDVSGSDGSFGFDSVPPGKYTVFVWHPRLGVTKDTVRVKAGEEGTVVLRLKAR